MEKIVVFCHGDKGGVGKSMIASVLVDYYLTHDLTPLVIEGDATIPDVARRYNGHVTGVRAPLGGDDATSVVAALIDHLESSPSDRVVINLPASAGEVLDPLAQDLIGPALEAIGYQTAVAFAVGKNADSARLAAASLTNGLASVAATRIAVINGYFASPGGGGGVEDYAWHQSTERQQWLESGGTEIWLPRLHDRIVPHVAEGPYSAGLTPEAGLSVANRILLQRWIEAAHQIGDLIEGAGGAGDGDANEDDEEVAA